MTTGAVFRNPDTGALVNPQNVDHNPDRAGYKLGKMFQPGYVPDPPLPPPDVALLIETIRSHHRMTVQGLPNDRSNALVRITEIGNREYARADGGRESVKLALIDAGYTRKK